MISIQENQLSDTQLKLIKDNEELKNLLNLNINVDNLIQKFSKNELGISQKIDFLKQVISIAEEQKKVYLKIEDKDSLEGYIDSIFYILIKVNYLVIQTIKSLKDKNEKAKIEDLKKLDTYKEKLYNLIYSLIIFSKKINEDLMINLSEIPWEIYEAVSETISDVSWCKISYANGVLKLVTNGEKHENIKGNIGDLIVYFCDFKEIDYYNFGSKTEKNDKLGVSKEPDVSYGFNGNKKTIDLAVEVNYSSGSLKDLEKYKALEIKEVWMWDNKENLLFFSLEENQYIEIKTSIFLTPLTPEIIKQCAILMREKKAITGKKEMIRIVEELELI
ncbi:MAG: Uma2 family endonuclease [Cyanobacteria bacterium P01_F01_bin.143]